jgi:YgiT-type zinc finger domain-containing protein
MVNSVTKCPSCGKGNLEKQRVEERMFGVSLGEFEGERCPKCGETFLDEAGMDELEKRARAAGVWGLGKKAKVAKSGNSLVIRIPSELAKYLHLKPGSEVFVHPEGEDRIVVDVES